MRNLIKNVVLSKALVNVASPALITASIATLGGVIFASDIESKNAINIAKLDSKDSIIIASLDSNQNIESKLDSKQNLDSIKVASLDSKTESKLDSKANIESKNIVSLNSKQNIDSKDSINAAVLDSKTNIESKLDSKQNLDSIKIASLDSKTESKLDSNQNIESKNAINMAKLDSKDSIIIASLDSKQNLESKNIAKLDSKANIESANTATLDSNKNIESNPITLADSSDSANNTSEVKSEAMSDPAQSTEQSVTTQTTEQSTQTTSDKTNTAVLNKVVTSATGFSLPLKDEPKNIILIDKQDLEDKGYSNLEQALEKQPSVTFVQGPQGTKEIDIRGQGLDATRAVKILVNRVPINLNDTGNGGHQASAVTPFNQIAIDDIESIEIIPGGGAVVYGNGTRGGVVNIVTKKPSKNYMRANVRGSMYEVTNPFGYGTGAGISAGRKIGENLFLGASANYSYQNGLRPKEYTHNIYTALNTYYEIDEKSKLEWNVSYSFMNRYFAGYLARALCTTAGMTTTCSGFKDRETMKNERYTSPAASQNTTGAVQQDFIQTSLNYTNKILENLDFDSILFYQFSYFRFPSQTLGANTRSYLSNHAVGLNLKTKWSSAKNTLITGIDNQFEASDTLSKSAFTNLENKGTKYSLSFYGLDSYKFFDFFSLSGGARGEISYFTLGGHTGMSMGATTSYYDVNAKKWQFGYALEVTPSYNYSDTGTIYAKQEIGFISPSVRQAVSTDPNWTGNAGSSVGPKVASNIKPEQYFTTELGWRDEFDWTYLSATLFYTHTLNEIRYNLYGFTTEYFNIGATQRFGIEFSGKQDFDIGGVLPLNIQESLSYIYSNVLKGRQTAMVRPGLNRPTASSSGALAEGKPVPYVPLLKIALLIDAEVLNINSHKLNVFWNNTYYGNQVDNNQFDMNPNGYFLSDIGINYKISNFHLSAGVRNLFDSFYIAYQNTSVNANTGALNGAGTYLAGEGRNYFLEGRYSF